MYPNNYKESDIRAWLNGTFYNWAFNANERTIIQSTDVDNSLSTTRDGIEKYECDNTNDQVFLLSWKDVMVWEFSYKYGLTSSTRKIVTTDYAQSQGVQTYDSSGVKIGEWWLRSPHNSKAGYARRIDNYGVDSSGNVGKNEIGVVPAIKIVL